MKVLIACEESQEVTKAFRRKGHEAYSCDLQPCSGGHPEWHLQMDVFEAMYYKYWEIIIIHTPCTFTAICGNRWYWDSPKRIEGAKFTKDVYEFAKSICNKVVLEQPKTIMQRFIGKKSQSIQPYEFGHGETKETWLWINGLPLLKPTNLVEGRENRIWKMPPSKDRAKLRSKTFPGIAKAMAEQWG